MTDDNVTPIPARKPVGLEIPEGDDWLPATHTDPEITMNDDDDRITFRDQAALDAYVAEALADFARANRDRMAEAWGGDSGWLTTGTKIADLVCEWLLEAADED